MRALLVCALVLALGLVNADSPCVCNYGSYQGRQRSSKELRERVDAQTARISRLSAAIQELQGRLDAGQDKREHLQNRQADISNRLVDLEPNRCGKKQFFCGKSDNNCIGKTAVCDGSKDCPQGADEDANRCKLPCNSGATFKGEVHDDPHLCTTRRINSISIHISSVRQLTWFKYRTTIEADIDIDHSTDEEEQHDSLRVKGYYDFSENRLVLLPPEDDRLGVACNFDGVSNNSAHCYVLREATLSRCLHFYVERQ